MSEAVAMAEDTEDEAQSAAPPPSRPAANADDGDDPATAETAADEAEPEGGQAAARQAPYPAQTENPPQTRGAFANLFAASGQAQAEGAQDPGPETAASEETGETAPEKRSFLSAFFTPAGTGKTESAIVETETEETDKPKLETVSLTSSPETKPSAMWDDPLPGVRSRDQLFEISRSSGTDDDSDIDLYEQNGSYQVASAAGLARLAPNGLLKQREGVDVSCFKPRLVRMLKTIERHFGKPVLVTSGYRSPAHNKRVRGARKSMHMQCAAADIQVAGVDRWELARFTRALPSRGGVGTYCHTSSVHVDVGPKRDWNWRCRR